LIVSNTYLAERKKDLLDSCRISYSDELMIRIVWKIRRLIATEGSDVVLRGQALRKAPVNGWMLSPIKGTGCKSRALTSYNHGVQSEGSGRDNDRQCLGVSLQHLSYQ
jgi:hypothetical protein